MNRILNFNEIVLEDLQLIPLLINILLCLALGLILTQHYLKYAPVLSNKKKFGRLLVFISMTTMMVITIVKTSLALSLGLVGALSIIRFRTPIKDPEDLAYLFMAIAVGVGMGADQRLATCMLFFVILGFLFVRDFRKSDQQIPRLLLHVSAQLDGTEGRHRHVDDALECIVGEIKKQATRLDLRRVDCEMSQFNANFVLDLDDAGNIGSLVRSIQEVLPNAAVTVVDGDGLD